MARISMARINAAAWRHRGMANAGGMAASARRLASYVTVNSHLARYRGAGHRGLCAHLYQRARCARGARCQPPLQHRWRAAHHRYRINDAWHCFRISAARMRVAARCHQHSHCAAKTPSGSVWRVATAGIGGKLAGHGIKRRSAVTASQRAYRVYRARSIATRAARHQAHARRRACAYAAASTSRGMRRCARAFVTAHRAAKRARYA